jgi:flagellar hook-basal body complex protein FliE
MQTRLDLYTRNLTLGQDTSRSTTLPITGESDNSFGDTFTRVLNEVSDTRDHAGDLAKRFAAGENVELHQVMAASEEAGVALDMVIELRNKVIEAYHSVISMQA